ncbi:MAG: DUF2065 domain-containing protein [Xanthobacteraceae bacterium]|jgi:uncharacterized protein YjeT (DUF2065 family)
MTDFLAALGLVLVIEGILLAAFPGGAKRTMASVMELPDGSLRIAGIIAAAVGLVIVWLIRG